MLKADGLTLVYNEMMDVEEVVSDAQKLKQGLKELPEPVANPVFVVVSGLPGTGKSRFSRKLVERLPSVIVESDALRKRLFTSPTYSAQESHRLFNACHRLIEELLGSGIPVILDATNLVEQHRERLYHISQRLGVKLIIVQVEAPRELVLQRLQGRSRGVDPEDSSEAGWSVYQRMRTRAERIRRNYFAVDTSRDITSVIDKVVREAKR
ncbi:MAG: ATP-binding protein [Dehalococcoidia bacterium]|nr:MAG: ATP-binding protein [Dehalococcoidia bacterium]